jgi:transposase
MAASGSGGKMRGSSEQQVIMLTALTPNDLVPAGHPIRQVTPIVERALAKLSPTFNQMYAPSGRPSIPPEHLLKASLLMVLFSVRSERQFCERLQYDLLFKWFLDLNIMDAAFDHSVFAKNRERLLEHAVAREFFTTIVEEARRRHLLSEEHFTVDGTLLEAWASMKSIRPKDEREEPPTGAGRNPTVDFRDQRRGNATHASTTDPEARLARKGPGQEARLCFAGHVLMENRQGLVVDVRVTQASGNAERDAALDMLQMLPGSQHRTVGADKGYDTKDFIWECRDLGITPHVAQRQRSAIDARTTRHPGYPLSQRVRKRVEEIFGWLKTVAGGRKLRYRGVVRNQLWAELALAGYNLVRMAKLVPLAA